MTMNTADGDGTLEVIRRVKRVNRVREFVHLLNACYPTTPRPERLNGRACRRYAALPLCQMSDRVRVVYRNVRRRIGVAVRRSANDLVVAIRLRNEPCGRTPWAPSS